MAAPSSAAAGGTASLVPALAWMAGALVSFLAMGVAGRELAVELAPHHISFYRNAISLLVLLPLVWRANWRPVRTAKPVQHALRNTIHFGAQWCWLFGVGALPLAEVFAIEFTAPIWTALIAAALLGERLTVARAVAIALGFAGILVILRPGLAIVDPAALVVLMASLGYAVTYVFTKRMTSTESALTVIWWMNVVQLLLGAALSLPDFVVPSPPMWPWVALVAASGLSSHYCLSRALSLADATVVVPLDFLRLPLAAVVAWLLYREAVDPFVVVGAAFVIAANWMNLKKG
jgi:drug/metabolite transporter (DMT)-like permease